MGVLYVCMLTCMCGPLYSLVEPKVNLELSSSDTLPYFLITNEFLLFYVYGYFICISVYHMCVRCTPKPERMLDLDHSELEL